MRLHGSCGARQGAGVLLVGAPGAGKSDLLLRLLDRGFDLVADDQVEVVDGVASAPPALAGLIEVRGLGLLRRDAAHAARLVLAVRLGRMQRMPLPCHYDIVDLPMVVIDPIPSSAAMLVELALDAVQGRGVFVPGLFREAGAFD